MTARDIHGGISRTAETTHHALILAPLSLAVVVDLVCRLLVVVLGAIIGKLTSSDERPHNMPDDDDGC